MCIGRIILAKVVFAGGGTGGHVYPALALADEFKRRGHQCHFVGTETKIEATLIPQNGYSIDFIWISGFQRSFDLSNLLFPIKVLTALWQSFKILKEQKPDLVVGTGGYVSGPVLYVAQKLSIPTLIQEQNSYPGITTKLLEKNASEVHIAYDYARQFLLSKHVFSSGNPIRQLQAAHTENSFDDYLDSKRLTIGIMGGSLGAKTINLAVAQLLNEKHALTNQTLIWQTGQTTFADFKDQKINHGIITAYIEHMADFYAASDIIICRAGAISLAELALAGKAAIIVPYKYAAEEHQRHNAAVFEQSDAAYVFEDDEHLALRLKSALTDLINNKERRDIMAKNMSELARPEATDTIVSHGIALIEKSAQKN